MILCLWSPMFLKLWRSCAWSALDNQWFNSCPALWVHGLDPETGIGCRHPPPPQKKCFVNNSVFPRTHPQGEFPVVLNQSRRGGVRRRESGSGGEMECLSRRIVWLSHNQGGREGWLLGSRNPVRRRCNLVMDRGAAPSGMCQRYGSIKKQTCVAWSLADCEVIWSLTSWKDHWIAFFECWSNDWKGTWSHSFDA